MEAEQKSGYFGYPDIKCPSPLGLLSFCGPNLACSALELLPQKPEYCQRAIFLDFEVSGHFVSYYPSTQVGKVLRNFRVRFCLRQKVCCTVFTFVLRTIVVASALPSVWLFSKVGALPNLLCEASLAFLSWPWGQAEEWRLRLRWGYIENLLEAELL